MRKMMLIERIKSYGQWMTYFDNAWLIRTYHDIASIQPHLLAVIANTDSLLIIEARPDNVGGLLLPKGWEWLRTR
jgi:hypothetical protein